MKIVIYNKKRRFAKKALAVLMIVAMLVFIALIVRSCITGRSQTDVFPEKVFDVPMYTQLVAEGDAARPGIERRIKYVVIHETGNFAKGADAEAHGVYLTENNRTTTSWHYTVDEDSIYHHIPDTEVAWHAGDSLTKNGGNLCGIGVEICVNRDGDFEKAFDNAAKLTAYLIKTYNLSIHDIRQHGDFISKNCPETIRNQGRSEEFVNLAHEYLKQIK